MALLREHEFRPFRVSGGGQEFIRSYSEPVYGMPPEQIAVATLETSFEIEDDGVPVLMLMPVPQVNDNNSGKPEDINLIIGPRNEAAFGNLTRDQQTLEWTGA